MQERWKPAIAWMLIWLFPQALHTVPVGEFTAMESTQNKPGKDSIKRKEKRKFNTFFTSYSERYYSARNRRMQEWRYAKH